MADRRPVTEDDDRRVRELHAEGLSRNAIAQALGRSGRTISRIADRLGLNFERERTRAATEAKKDDAAHRRATLQLDALAGANRLMSQMFAPTVVFNFGGKENDYNERSVEEPPFRDKQAIALAIAQLAATALKLAEYDKATGNEDEKSMLTDLREALMATRTSSSP